MLKRRAAHKLKAEASCYPPACSSGHQLASISVSENTPLPPPPSLAAKTVEVVFVVVETEAEHMGQRERCRTNRLLAAK